MSACLQRAHTLPVDEREEAGRAAKQRLLGNVRLIGQLLNKAMVNDRIVLLIMSDLLGSPDAESGGKRAVLPFAAALDSSHARRT